MAKQDKFVQNITPMDTDFAQWYTDVVTKAELTDYSSVRGCMILRPYGYAIWENIQHELDRRLKELGHVNVAMPMFIPESLLQKEKDHVEGFAPEVAWVTHGGDNPLQERLCVRPTSETLFCDHYAKIIHSWRDLPKLYNQWVSVCRWEKTTRPFLRTTEFYWQEGHTAHATQDEAIQEALTILNVYRDLYKEFMAIPVISGRKTEKEKFAGAESTWTVEAMMHDGKALQAATSHYFGDGFARAFNIQYSDPDNVLRYVHQTSWGISTRSIGGLIMVHGDDDGLILPPRVAPIQVALIPIAMQKEGVKETAQRLESQLKKSFRVQADYSDKMPGWKFSEYEMKGVPVRLELGPRDIEAGQCVAVRRDTREKITLSLNNIESELAALLDQVHDGLYQKALDSLNSRIYRAHNLQEFEELITTKQGFIQATWNGDPAIEAEIKEKYQATSRCISEADVSGQTCIFSGEPAKYDVYWGKSY